MKAELNIKVNIGGRPYNMAIERSEEEFVRKAAESVNKTIKEYSKAFEYKDMQDLYAMIALQFASGFIKIEEDKSFREREMEDKLVEIDSLLSHKLNTIENRS